MSEKIRILLVDDHSLFRQGIRLLLGFYADFEVVGEASDGAEAVKLIGEIKPHVILMDIDMPKGVGGVAATTMISKTCPDCRVILLTGYHRYVTAGVQAGASGYLLKDAVGDIIADAIRTVQNGGVYFQQEIQELLVRSVQNRDFQLSERDINVLRLIADGKSNREIGESLDLSESCIRQTVSDILKKLDACDRAHAVAIAFRSGLL